MSIIVNGIEYDGMVDLYAGLGGSGTVRGGWATPFRDRGWKSVITIDIEAKFNPTIVEDMLNVTAADIIKANGGKIPIVVCASPPCTSFSIAGCRHHWDAATGQPKSPAGILGQKLLRHTLKLMAELKPLYWWMENPRGLMRKQPEVQNLTRTTVAYCQYGEKTKKPTDLWGVWPTTWKPRAMCKSDPRYTGTMVDPTTGEEWTVDSQGKKCHQTARRGTWHSGVQSMRGNALRSVIPYELSDEIAEAVEQAISTLHPQL